jgi:hypothetical protein
MNSKNRIDAVILLHDARKSGFPYVGQINHRRGVNYPAQCHYVYLDLFPWLQKSIVIINGPSAQKVKMLIGLKYFVIVSF